MALKNLEARKEYNKKYRQEHKDTIYLKHKLWVEGNREYVKQYHKQYHREWYLKNKSKRDIENAEWAKNNKDKIRKIKETFFLKHPEVSKGYLKKYQVTLKGRYRSMKGSGVKRNYSVGVTFDDFCKIVSNPCKYCGEKEVTIGIDRIDNNKGYTIENSAPCCKICNFMKKTMTVKDFLSHVNKINNFNCKK